ncbi:MAG: tetratricopeptide repeat protein [Magnetococcus sp. YQC-5]
MIQCHYLNKIQVCHTAWIGLTSQEPEWWKKALEYHQKGELKKAEKCYRKVEPFMPMYIPSLSNLGLIYNALRMHKEAEKCCLKALSLNPDFLGASINLGNALFGLGRLEEAEERCRYVLSCMPDSIEALGTLGNVLSAMGRIDEAERYYRHAVLLKPDALDIQLNFGNVLINTGRFSEAEIVLKKIIAFQNNHVAALNNLGYTLATLGKLVEAKVVFLQAISFRPDDVNVRVNFGSLLNTLGHYEDAEACYRKGLEFHPESLELLSNLVFLQHYRGEHAIEKGIEDAKKYGALVASQARPFTHHPNPENQNKRLRIGLVSGDLMSHPVGYFLEGIVSQLRLHNIELFVYSTYFREDALSLRMKQAVSHWSMVMGVPDAQLAEQIRADGVDILMDLSGHTDRNRLALFAWKPAPVQVTWLGYFATTGLTAMDYILGDPVNLPAHESNHFVESPWPLPECYLCCTPPDLPIQVNPLPAIENGYVTFGSFNNPNKMTTDVIACWAEILDKIPRSRLFLKYKSLADPHRVHMILEKFGRHDITPDRLILEGPTSRDLYFTSYHQVDIGLDPFPYPGVTTSVDGLWMGVPFITKKGNHYLAHQGESILTNAGLPDWIASDTKEYIATAVSFANDLPKLARLRQRLRHQVLQSPLFDTKRFAKHLVYAWQEMWQIWCTSKVN